MKSPLFEICLLAQNPLIDLGGALIVPLLSLLLYPMTPPPPLAPCHGMGPMLPSSYACMFRKQMVRFTILAAVAVAIAVALAVAVAMAAVAVAMGAVGVAVHVAIPVPSLTI